MAIKDDPELRHVLSHMYMAIEALIDADPVVARYELDSIAGLVFFEDDQDTSNYLNRRNHGQGQEEVHGETAQIVPGPEQDEARSKEKAQALGRLNAAMEP